MKKAQYDLGHYAIYFILFIISATIIFSVVLSIFGEQQYDVFKTMQHLDTTFAAEHLLNCFLDNNRILQPNSFNNDRLAQCTTRNTKLTFAPFGNKESTIISTPEQFQPDTTFKEYIITPNGGGILTIDIETI